MTMRPVKTAAFILLVVALSIILFNGRRKSDSIPYTIIESGTYIYYRSDKPSVKAFTEAQTFQNFYGSIHRSETPIPDSPLVDFERDMVLFLSYGEKRTAGYSLEVTGVYRQSSMLVINTLLIIPQKSNMQAQVITHPYILLSTPMTEYERIEIRDEHGEPLDWISRRKLIKKGIQVPKGE